MKTLLSNLPCFQEVAVCLSFTQAADNLSMPLATVSRRIAALEKALGVKLFYRNTRTISLTEEGQDLFESGKIIISEALSVRDRLQQKQIEPSGIIRIAIEPFVYHCFMHTVLPDFSQKYPKIRLNTVFPNEWVDLHVEPFDIDIRSGPAPHTELRVRKILSVYPNLYASPKLLRSFVPGEPKELIKLPFISQQPDDRYTLSCTKGDMMERVTLRPWHNAQSIRLALGFVLAGQGIAAFLPSIAKHFEEKGELIRLLPDWNLEEMHVHLTLPDRQQPKRVRLFVEHLISHFQRSCNKGKILTASEEAFGRNE